ncbi:F-box/FBD/LRR-repeat protein At1g13570 [Lolium perenne]|uniref:F-box/FBD/LRR-repeat protein At1g13570 n=1 Tax=Lolium perenne TaxID=4522 RepID=UPI0021F67EA5|nr:F-box/FBD/LRR-repeat protein At1g13570-like [Lolium perenne]
MAAAVLHVLRWFPGGESIARAKHSFLSCSDADGGYEDRISALHDHLLHHILSRLPAKDAARTAALASRWRHLWRSTPLVFHDHHLLPSRDRAHVAAVARVLAAHPGPFRTVSIGYCDFACHDRELAEWPRLLAAKGVQDLALVNMPADFDRLPAVPADVLRCDTFRRLLLGFWKFPDAGAHLPAGGADGFPHLWELIMFGNEMPGGRDLDHLLARCPVLHTFAVSLSKMFQRVHLRNQSFRCVLLWHCFVEEVAVMDSPLLERLILWEIVVGQDFSVAVRVKIAAGVPKLQVLGYLEPRLHQLQIGDIVIKPDTMASPSTMVPSVKILALKVNFGVLKEVKMLASILRCFPNVDTLHIESLIGADGPTGKHNAKFWRGLCLPIKCVTSRVKKMFIHEFHGHRSEIEFLKFAARSAEKLGALLVGVTEEIQASARKLSEATAKVAAVSRTWACGECIVLVLGPRVDNIWSFRKASDLSVKDPFH